MKLGTLVLAKLAQDQGGLFFPNVMQSIEQHRDRGSPTYGLQPSQSQGLVTGGQALVGGAGLLGEMPQEIAQIAMPIIQIFAPEWGARLNRMYKLPGVYGGNEAAANEFMQIQRQMMAKNNVMLGNQLKPAIGNLVSTATSAARSWGIQLPEGIESKIGAMLEGANPQIVGMIGSIFGSMFPEAKNMMAAFSPNVIWDTTALQNAAYAAGNGQFNPAIYQNLINQVEAAYDTGKVPQGVTKQVLTEAVAASMKLFGTNTNMDQAINLAKAADSYVTNGVARNFGDALVMMGSYDPKEVATNPTRIMQDAAVFGRDLQEGKISREDLTSAIDMASSKGIPIKHAISSVRQGAPIAAALAGKMDQGRIRQHQQEAMGAYMNTASAPQFRLLAAAHAVADDAGKQYIETALNSGNIAALRQTMERAKYNPKAMALREHVNPTNLMQMTSPELMQQWMMRDAGDIATYQKNPELARILANPEELKRRVTTGDFSGLRTGTAKALTSVPLTGAMLSASNTAQIKAPRMPAPGQLGGATPEYVPPAMPKPVTPPAKPVTPAPTTPR